MYPGAPAQSVRKLEAFSGERDRRSPPTWTERIVTRPGFFRARSCPSLGSAVDSVVDKPDTPADLHAYLDGSQEIPNRQYDVTPHAINERFVELKTNLPSPTSRHDAPTPLTPNA